MSVVSLFPSHDPGTDRYITNFANRLSHVEITEALEYRSAGSVVNGTDVNINLLA